MHTILNATVKSVYVPFKNKQNQRQRQTNQDSKKLIHICPCRHKAFGTSTQTVTHATYVAFGPWVLLPVLVFDGGQSRDTQLVISHFMAVLIDSWYVKFFRVFFYLVQKKALSAELV